MNKSFHSCVINVCYFYFERNKLVKYIVNDSTNLFSKLFDKMFLELD